MIPRLLRNKLLWGFVAVWALAFLVIPFAPRIELYEIVDGIFIAVSVGALVGYLMAVYRILSQTTPSRIDSADALLIGTFLIYVAALVVFGNLWVYRIWDDPETLNHWVGLFGRWMFVTAAAFHLVAAGAKGGAIPSRSYLKAGIWVAIGVAAGMLTISLGFY